MQGYIEKPLQEYIEKRDNLILEALNITYDELKERCSVIVTNANSPREKEIYLKDGKPRLAITRPQMLIKDGKMVLKSYYFIYGDCWVEKAKEFMLWKAEKLNMPEMKESWLLDWLEQLGEEKCREWLEELHLECEEDLEEVGDPDLCPFCFVSPSCSECAWGKRYGKCIHKGSLYNRFVSSTGNSIIQTLGRDQIKEKVNSLINSNV